MMILKNKTFCITGGSGFVGSHLIDYLIDNGAFVRTIDKTPDLNLKKKYGDKINLIVGDIKNIKDIECLITNDCDGIFHLAAFKYVGLAEKKPTECINSNIIGTLNILEISNKYNLDFVLGVSTAASVHNTTYGSTKKIMEKLFEENQINNKLMKFRIIRLGNILGSTGSVSDIWKNSIIENDDIQISNGESTRFFMDVKETIDMIFECLETETSEPYIPNIKSMSLNNLLNAMLKKYSTQKINIIVKEVRNKENNHEKLHENGPYSNEVEQYTIEEIIKKI